MDFRSLNALLAEALANADEGARYEIFVEVTPDLGSADVARLVQLGVRRQRDNDTVVTAHLFLKDLDDLSELPTVGQMRLGRQASTNVNNRLVSHTLASSRVCPKVCPNAFQEPSVGSQRHPSSQ